MKQKSARRSTAGVKVFVASASLAATLGGWVVLAAANADQLQQSNLDVPTANAAPGFGQSPFGDSGGQFQNNPSQSQPSAPNVQQVDPNQFNNSAPRSFRRTHSSR